MGLTVHYRLKSNQTEVKETVAKMRQLALDLPFEQVSEIFELSGDECNYENYRIENEENEMLRWMLIQAEESVTCPWNKNCSRRVGPTKVIAFSAWPGNGSEPANIGLCKFPESIEWEYKPKDDRHFCSPTVDGWHRFDYDKWVKLRDKPTKWFTPGFIPDNCHKTYNISTKLKGWEWSSFCKTQYASSPECGGVPNFLRCHISLITLLERIEKLPGVKVKISDEGSYGGPEGKHSPSELAKEVGDWNGMIAAFAGVLKDSMGDNLIVSPIHEFSNFEQLEFAGSKAANVDNFLKAMKEIAKKTTVAE